MTYRLRNLQQSEVLSHGHYSTPLVVQEEARSSHHQTEPASQELLQESPGHHQPVENRGLL